MAKNSKKSDVNQAEASKWLSCIRQVTEHAKADIYTITGGLYKPVDEQLINSIKQNRSQPNAILLLTTFGGDADVAYRIARCFQKSYNEGVFTIFVSGVCKSAGTLVTIGASELVMTDCAELGPLDVQFGKPDEIGEYISGLTPVHALDFLKERTFELFEHSFLSLISRSGYQITTKTAAEIATKLTDGVFHPVYAQLDPFKLGEYHRNMKIAAEYGKRLMANGNLKSEDSLTKLTHGYPSHSFVIDKQEAEDLYNKIRQPNLDEIEMAERLRSVINVELQKTPAAVHYIKPPTPEQIAELIPLPEVKGEQNNEKKSEANISTE
jgi:hypothetical protein